jgi:DNA polymerase-1
MINGEKMIVSIDTETVSLDDKTMLAFSYTIDDKTTVVPVAMNTTKNTPKKTALDTLTELINNYTVIFHNSSFDIPVLCKFGVPFELFEKASRENRLEDTVIMANIIDENIQHGLKPLVKRYFRHQMTEFKEVCGVGKKQISFADVSWDIAKKYSAEDAHWTYKLYHVLLKSLQEDSQSYKIYTEIERPLLIIVADMHIHGITIDVKKLKEVTDLCNQKITLLKDKLDITMGDVNLDSPKQLCEFFIKKKGLPIIKTTDKNAPSMDKEVLEAYAETDIDAKLLLEYRKYTKLAGTFLTALTPTTWDIDTWRGSIFTSFHQAGTTSGRFSSSNPNMQNIPTSSEINVRDCVVADQGHTLIGADYSQIELRVLAEVSQDFHLMKAYKDKEDIHKVTADACGVERRVAKTINFGLVYGMGAKTLGKRIDVSYEEAQNYIQRFFDKYPGIKEFWNSTEQKARALGFVETCFGRKRHLTIYFYAKDEYDQGAEIRSIINSVIQGTSADIMKIAMRDLYEPLKSLGARIISTVHDEIIVSCPEENAQKAYDLMNTKMVAAGESLSVPIEVKVKIGKTWSETKDD